MLRTRDVGFMCLGGIVLFSTLIGSYSMLLQPALHDFIMNVLVALPSLLFTLVAFRKVVPSLAVSDKTFWISFWNLYCFGVLLYSMHYYKFNQPSCSIHAIIRGVANEPFEGKLFIPPSNCFSAEYQFVPPLPDSLGLRIITSKGLIFGTPKHQYRGEHDVTLTCEGYFANTKLYCGPTSIKIEDEEVDTARSLLAVDYDDPEIQQSRERTKTKLMLILVFWILVVLLLAKDKQN
mmetsp:Transcript_7535/g.10414  ORF Transcript_7535/g.10414 Transcript_7535/m.10414 type:complete len:235 (+) Transcript_7535:20-724(+)